MRPFHVHPPPWVAGIVLWLAAASYGPANPIPWPPYSETIHVDIVPATDTLRASFTGDFLFLPYLPDSITTMTFPVPPDAQIQTVAFYNQEISWYWVEGTTYPTVLPEQPFLPLIGWDVPPGPPPQMLKVEYNHNLIARGDSFIFLYAVGSGKVSKGYDVPSDAVFEIVPPPGYLIDIVQLDFDPCPYTLYDGALYVSVFTETTPETRDLIVTFVPLEPLSGWLLR